MSLRDALQTARNQQIALAHYNVSSIEVVWAIVEAAKTEGLPVVIGVSEGERDFIGVREIVAVINSIKNHYYPQVYLNADHTYSLEKVKEVVEAGFDSVVFDGAKLSFEENMKQTRQVVDYVKAIRPEMLVEAEVGYIGMSSKLLDEMPPDVATAQLPTSEMVLDFIQETGIDCVAPAVGNIHGMLKNVPNPTLNHELITAISAATNIPLVLHGGSGISDDDFRSAIRAGISLIHINTELRVAWKKALTEALSNSPDEISPYKLLDPSRQAVMNVAKERMRLFSSH